MTSPRGVAPAPRRASLRTVAREWTRIGVTGFGGLLAAAVAFSPSFSFVLLGGGRFERLRANANARAFLDGAGPAAIGAILGAAIPLAGALNETWQAGVLGASAVALLVLGRGVVEVLLAAGAVGVIGALAGVPLP